MPTESKTPNATVSEYERLQWQAMTEKQYMQQIADAAQKLGWRVYHTFLAVYSAQGFPDLVCVRGGRMLCLEVKRQKGKLTERQVDWLRELAKVPGVEALVVRPSDFDDLIDLLLGKDEATDGTH